MHTVPATGEPVSPTPEPIYEPRTFLPADTPARFWWRVRVVNGHWLYGTSEGYHKVSQAKITEATAAMIRLLYAEGHMTQQAIGNRFGITGSMVGLIVRNKNWTEE